jgi:hypothetical protein
MLANMPSLPTFKVPFVASSGVFREGGAAAVVRPPPPPIGVIRGAVVGVWLGFCLAKGRKEGRKWKNVKSY